MVRIFKLNLNWTSWFFKSHVCNSNYVQLSNCRCAIAPNVLKAPLSIQLPVFKTPGLQKCEMYTESVTANGLFILVVRRTFVTAGFIPAAVFIPNSHSPSGYVEQVKAITLGGWGVNVSTRYMANSTKLLYL